METDYQKPNPIKFSANTLMMVMIMVVMVVVILRTMTVIAICQVSG